MKYLKRINESSNTSDYEVDFWVVMDIITELLDDYDLDLEMRNGISFMEYKDYLEKNHKYRKFVEHLNKLDFIHIILSNTIYDNKKMIEIMSNVHLTLEKFDMSSWSLESISSNIDFSRSKYFKIDIQLTYN